MMRHEYCEVRNLAGVHEIDSFAGEGTGKMVVIGGVSNKFLFKEVVNIDREDKHVERRFMFEDLKGNKFGVSFIAESEKGDRLLAGASLFVSENSDKWTDYDTNHKSISLIAQF